MCLCKKVTVAIGSKTAIADLFCFFWYNVVLCVSNHLFEKNLSFLQVYHVLINDIEIWIKRKKSCYSKEHIPVLYMLINCISTRSAPRLLSIKADRWVVNFLSFVSDVLFERLHNWFFMFFLKLKWKTVNFNLWMARVTNQKTKQINGYLWKS